jgi:signal transduction histidine kinase
VSAQLAAGPSSAQVLSRFAVPVRGPAFWLTLWTLAAAGEFAALVPVIFGTEPIAAIDVAYRLVGGTFAACGLVAWHRRPDSRVGLLMTLSGYGFLLSPILGQFHFNGAITLAYLTGELYSFPWVALLLTVVSGGRLFRTLDKALVVSFLIPLLLLQFVWLLFLDIDGNVLAMFPDEGIASAIDTVQRSTAALASAATAIVLVARFRAASPPRRRALFPSLGGAVTLTMFATLLSTDLFLGERSVAVFWVAIVSLVLTPAALLWTLLRSRLARSSLTGLLGDLRTLRGADLERVLAKALGDPSLQLVGALPSEPPPGRAVAPIVLDGRPMAALVYDVSLDEDPELVEAVAAAAAVALETGRLQDEAEVRVEELRASRERIVAAGDAARRRLERDLHDGAQQRLVAVALQLRLLRGRVKDADPSIEQQLVAAGEELANSLDELRELARGIHPAVLDHGLPAALDSLASRSPVLATVSCTGVDDLPEPVELAAYFVASEALTNVAKYAQASVVAVDAHRSNGHAVIQIADDGVGGAQPGAGSGLRGLSDRVEALGGVLRVTSPAGHGTVVTAELPCGGGD